MKTDVAATSRSEFADIAGKVRLLQENLERIIKGKPEVIRQAITTFFARGHLLIEDVPGVGKTTLAHGLAKSINCTFQRIQFTSDLLPSDIIGITIYNQEKHTFDFKPGPVFAHIVLADEINRTAPKTQSALLEAMNDRQVSIDRITHTLPAPFMVIATQNPLEYEGTYPLPESQMDRFMMRIKIDHDLVDYILAIVNATRKSDKLQLGVSPRGAMALYRAAQASALVDGRTYCIPDDIKRLSISVFSHRVVSSPGLEGETEDVEGIIQEMVENIEVPL